MQRLCSTTLQLFLVHLFTLTTAAAATNENGLRGEYFDNGNLTTLRFTRVDPVVDFNWGQSSPDASIATDTFSIRWTGEVVPRFSQTYTFSTYSDDGVRLWVNGQRIINNWVARLPATDTGVIFLKADQHYSIQLEFFENAGDAIISLGWSSQSQPYEIIPQSRLFTPVAGLNHPPNSPIVFAPQENGMTLPYAEASFRTDTFSDPDTGDTHSCSEWEIWKADRSERVWSAGCQPGLNLVSITLTNGVFENSHAGRSSLVLNQEYIFRVRHVDSSGAIWSQASVWAERNFNTMRALKVLIPSGSSWRFRDNSVDQGTAWRGTNFTDTLWRSGRAQLGFGDGDEVTTTCCSSGTRPITTYFRRAFTVTNSVSITNLIVRLLRDDGGAVYVNSNEVFRSNLPGGTISYSTLASTSAGADTDEGYYFYSTSANPRLLRDGTNIVAVEIHQSSSTSSDLSFDFELWAEIVPPPPRLQIAFVPPDCNVITWSEPDFVLEEASACGGPWSEVAGNPPSPFTVCSVQDVQFFRLKRRR
jgi:hypothetical protein